MYEATKPYNTPWVVRATRFPILRSSPLWKQTWVQGEWFPPLSCVGGPFGMRRRITMPQTRTHRTTAGSYTLRSREYSLVRLYSVDNCPECTTALQAIELMVYSVARFLADEPEQWEHQCWFPDNGLDEPNAHPRRCVCGKLYSITDLNRWLDEVQWAWIDTYGRRAYGISFGPGMALSAPDDKRDYRIVMA